MEKLLILGGSNFIGRNLVETLLKENRFDLTLFNRGQTAPELFPNVKRIQGDRNTTDIQKIFEETWDYVIDLSCFFPNSLSEIVSHLKGSIKRYVFISSCSVYDNAVDQSILRKETSAVLSCTEDEGVDTSNTTYGKRKAACEKVLKECGLTYSIFRPALVYGPYDNTDRFYYWLYQVKNQNEVVLPNKGENVFSVTYVHDLVQAILKSLTPDLSSEVYTITSSPKMSIANLIETASLLLDSCAQTHAVNSIFLEENNVAPWTDLPLWLDCNYFTYDNSKVQRELKLDLTDFNQSVAETIEYYKNLLWPEPSYGMSDKAMNALNEKLK